MPSQKCTMWWILTYLWFQALCPNLPSSHRGRDGCRKSGIFEVFEILNLHTHIFYRQLLRKDSAAHIRERGSKPPGLARFQGELSAVPDRFVSGAWFRSLMGAWFHGSSLSRIPTDNYYSAKHKRAPD